jgi:hypothetical protein
MKNELVPSANPFLHAFSDCTSARSQRIIPFENRQQIAKWQVGELIVRITEDVRIYFNGDRFSVVDGNTAGALTCETFALARHAAWQMVMRHPPAEQHGARNEDRGPNSKKGRFRRPTCHGSFETKQMQLGFVVK